MRAALVSVVSGSAVGCGACEWWVRCSLHSESGLVLVAGFLSSSQAGRFASLWAGRLGVSVQCRALGRGWCVSVPVVR